MKKYLLIANLLDKINQYIAIASRWSVLLMIGIGVWNVIGRYLGAAIGWNLSSNRLIESQWYLFSFIFLLGLSWTFQKKGHVRVDILQGAWEVKRKLQVEILGTIFLLLPFTIGVMFISIHPTIESWRINELSPDPDGLPRYLIKTLIPLGFLFLTLQGISQTIKDLFKLQNTKASNNLVKGRSLEHKS